MSPIFKNGNSLHVLQRHDDDGRPARTIYVRVKFEFPLCWARDNGPRYGERTKKIDVYRVGDF